MSVERRTPTHSGDDHMVERIIVQGPEDVPLTEVLDALTDVWGEVPRSNVVVHGSSWSWRRLATQEEQQQSLKYRQDRADALERWERQTLERLKEKYGDG